MPHIIVEYTEDLPVDMPDLLSDLHENLSQKPTINIDAIKTRALAIEDCVVGAKDAPDTFMHITLKLMPGRDDTLKMQMAQGLHKTARKHAPDETVSISVEVMELHEASYTK